MNHIPDSEGSGSEGEPVGTPEGNHPERESSQPHSVLSHRFRETSTKARAGSEGKSDSGDQIAIVLPAPERPWDYRPYRGHTTVDAVLREVQGRKGQVKYEIEFEDGQKAIVPSDQILRLRNGQNALDLFVNGKEETKSSSSVAGSQADSSDADMATRTGKRIRTKPPNDGFVNIFDAQLDSDDGNKKSSTKKRRLDKGRISNLATDSTRSSRATSTRGSRQSSKPAQDNDDHESSASEDDSVVHTKRGKPSIIHTRPHTRATRSTATKPSQKARRSSSRQVVDENEDENDELLQDPDEASDNSDIVYTEKKSTRPRSRGVALRSQRQGKGNGRARVQVESSSSEEVEQPTRRSGRERVKKSMKEHDVDEEAYADEVAKPKTPVVISIREIYQPIESKEFLRLHNKTCDVCSRSGELSNKGKSPLIHCQGCSTVIHKVCLGYRSTRDAMVTKVGHENFVMQCRRCIGLAQKKDPSTPSLNKCQTCKQVGVACVAFSTKKTSKQEETLRKENGGTDPITEVSPDLINNANNVLFRCTRCQRGWHYEHLPRPKKMSKKLEDPNDIRNAFLKEYGVQWQCRDCLDHAEKPSGLVAWRPLDKDFQASDDLTLYDFAEDDKEYLVRWEDQSYFQCTWMPGSWVYGVVAAMSRNAFARREDGANEKPKWTDEEAIPEEFLRMEIVFDVEYDARFVPKSEESDKAQISMVDLVLVKFQGLGYEDVVWEAPPTPDEPQRWSCFVSAYNEFVVGRYFKQSPASDMKKRLDKFHGSNFAKAVKVKQQPEALAGGTLMAYQKDGMNWMLENFHKKKNVILADEMGLGKTIQVIALLAYLVKTSPKVWPFLIVTPNSTCPNWRREIKKWIPSLRVVTYYGGAKALDMARNFELYPEGSSELRAHVVVTSYEAPVQDTNFFRKIKWAGMIVDEGQRLKNDENLLYSALKSLKTPWQCLLTGTPLQNNIRELFNLLAFLDDSVNAAQLEAKFEGQMTTEAAAEIQTMIRPFYLRRTKLHVLKDLPSLTQVILPVSMSIVQKKLYKSILAKNPNLIKSIFGQRNSELRSNERSNLNNILIQLRKCLCHPFIYSSAIEERSVGEEALHRNLIDASSKFQLLELMLPKLQARGHRVLLFSQFLLQLDLIEDFLKGLGLPFRRLDGTMDALQKQKRIDEFNAPNSEIFAFLLSTRSGGVGINLATADTVIIMDPDFNPQQDIQAISRAHRIGQKKNVLVFQLMTKDTAEEKIIQIGRKKIALGALIETDGVEDEEEIDLESILKHGTKALFEDDDQNDIRYDSHSVDKLLDRSQVEATKTTEEKQQSQFALARVWAHDREALGGELEDAENGDETPNLSIWEGILKQREADAAAEAAKNMQDFGRGKRARHLVSYEKPNMEVDDDATTSQHTRRRTGRSGSVSDGEFAAATVESEAEEHDSDSHSIDPRELSTGKHTKDATGNQFQPDKAIPSSQQAASKTGDKPKSSKQNKAQHIPAAQTSLPVNGQLPGTNEFHGQFGAAPDPSQQQRLPDNQHQFLHQLYQPSPPLAHSRSARQPLHSPAAVPSNGYNPQFSQQDGRFSQAINQRPQSAAAYMKQLCPLCGFDHSGSNICPIFNSENKCRLMLDALERNQSLDPLKRLKQKVAVQFVTKQLEALNIASQAKRSVTMQSEVA